MIQVSDQLYQFYHQTAQSQGLNTDKAIIDVSNLSFFPF